MLSFRLQFVGLQLLLLAYMAQSFVLLTANIDDIKKLARKFFSDTVADKLTDFVVKATEQMTGQMNDPSGKDGANDDISKSNEDELHKIARQNEEKEEPQTTKRDNSITTRKEDRQKPNYLSTESKELSIERDERLLDNEKKWESSSKETSKEQTERQVKSTTRNWQTTFEKPKYSENRISTKPKNDFVENNEMSNNDVFSRELPKSKDESQYIKQNDKKKELDDQNKQSESFYRELQKGFNDLMFNKQSSLQPSFDSFKELKPPKTKTKTVDERLSEFVETHMSGPRYKKVKDRDSKSVTFDFKPAKSKKSTKKAQDTRVSYAEKYPGSMYKKVKHRDLKTPAKSKERNNLKSNYNKLWKSETSRSRGLSLDQGDRFTTKKEKTDFDQYENRNYPKADYVATSGRMMLPRIPDSNETPKPDVKSWVDLNRKLPNAAQLKSWLATV